MTIDEAIEHAEEVAKENDKLCKRYDDASGYTRSGIESLKTKDARKCEKCAEEHRQLAEWLRELKALRQETCDDAISRQAVLKLFATHDGKYLFEAIRDLPSVTPKQTEITLESAIDYLHSIGWLQKHDKELTESAEKQRTGHWIPVSERLPEDIKPVIVTWKNTDPKSYYQYIVGKHFIGAAHYKGGKWFWYSSVTEDLLAEYGRCDSEEFDEAIEVVSWIPLPKPFEPQESEEQT